MGITYRSVKGSRLTSNEVDSNFRYLDLRDSALSQRIIDLPDSSQVLGLIDSAHVQLRQDYSYTSLINVPDLFDSNDATILVDSAYVQLRQDYSYTSLINVPNPDLFDSNDATILVDSAYVNARLDTSLFLDSAEAIDIIDGRVTKTYIDALNVDADTLDSISSESFLRSDVADTKTAGNLNFNDNVRLIFDNNLTVYRASGLSTIAVTNSGVNGGYLLTDGKWQMRKSAHDGDIIGVFDGDGAVELYYDGDKKFETTNTGAALNGEELDASWVQSRQITYDFLDSAEAQGMIDSNFGAINTDLLPYADSTYDLGSPTKQWKDLYLSGSTLHLGGVKFKATDGGTGLQVLDVGNSEINLGGGLTQSQVDARVALNSINVDSGQSMIDSSILATIPTSDKGKQYFIKTQGDNKMSPDYLIRTSDKYLDDSADLAIELLDTPTLQQIFNEWDRFSHNSSGIQPANATEAAAWTYNSGSNTISSTVNSSTVTGFYSPDNWDNFELSATFASSSSDNDILFIVAAFVVSGGREQTITVYRQGTGGIGGLGNFGIVLNMGQSDQAVLADGSSLANSGANNWNVMGNTRVKVIKRGNTITATCAQFGGTTLDPATEISYDLSSSAATQPFAGSVKYGYGAWSQDNGTFSNTLFEPDDPKTLIHFGGTLSGNPGGDIYVYEDVNTQWGIDSDRSLADTPGRIYHNTKTGRTFWNDGTAGYSIGTVRQFNDVIFLKPISAEPDSAETGGLGKRPGMFATADGVSWDPASKGTGNPYPVFWDGSSWNALY